MTRLAACALVAAAALAAPGGAGAVERIVEMHHRSFEPRDLVALVGDSVVWRNADSARHDIRSFAAGFDSGLLEPGQSYTHLFDRQGTFGFVCTIHRFMTGSVAVYGLALEGPKGTVPAGGNAVFTGLAPSRSASVTVERREVDGSYAAVTTVPVAADGSFRASVAVEAPAAFRASSGELASADVRVSVGSRLELSARPRGRAFMVVVTARPGQAGAAVVLERYVRERFAWEPLALARLDARSRAAFRVLERRARYVRAVIERGVRGYGPSASAPLTLRR